MRAAAFLLAFCLAATSGCAGPDGADDVPRDSASSSTAATNSSAPAPPPTTDTLHFLGAPAMTVAPSKGAEDVRSTVTYRGGSDPAEGATWRYTLVAPGKAGELEAHLWIKVTETLAVQPDKAACAWSLSVLVSGGTYPALCSPPGGTTIPPGDYELKFSSTGPGSGPVAVAAGSTFTFQLKRFAFSASTNDAVFALGGTAAHDSLSKVVGIEEPLPAPT